MTIDVLHSELGKASGAAMCPHRNPWQRRLLVPLARIAFPITVEGWQSNTALTGPCIFAADHGSHLDSLAILAALPAVARARVRVAAAEDYWYRDPLRRMAVGALGGFPFERKGLAGIHRAIALVGAGHSILIYPEGTRGGGPFRPGVGILAARTGVPVIPVAVRGGRALWPKGRALPRRGPVTVAFGAPLRILPGTPPQDAARWIETAVRALAAGETPEQVANIAA
jgi:1-acyl-sn-glycerol-3-phosphate acyltransferase